MALEIFNNNGYKYIRIVENKYVNANGKPSCRKTVIKNFGPVSKYDDGKENFEERLKESFRNGNPIIPELYEYVNKKPVVEKYDISFKEGDPDCIGHVKVFANALIERILQEIGVTSFVSRYKAFTNYEFDLLGFVRALIYGRILKPESKAKTIEDSSRYYNDLLSNCYKYNVYDTLSFLADYRDNMLNWVNKRIINKFKRTTNVIYYDVTNFFFEIEDADEDDGLRQFGVSKEHRKQPIVQMGLFMDEQGMPISIETFKGNTLDHLTVKKALSSSIENLNFDRFIFVGDRGMYRGDNSYYLVDRNNGYIVSKSIEKTAKEEKDWIFDDNGYNVVNDNYKYKSKIVKRKVTTSEGKREVTEKVVVYFSKKFYDKQMHENKSFLDVLEKIENDPGSFRFTKSLSSSVRRFLKPEAMNNKSGEMIKYSDLKSMIDYDKVNKYKKSFGYYQIVSSEINMPDLDIIETYHGLTKIEDQFRVMKGDLETRPLYVRTPEHINSHLLICMYSLVVYRIIQNKIKEKEKTKAKNQYEYGMSCSRIQEALNKWTVTEITNGYYRFNDIDDKDLVRILNAFDIKIENKLYKKLELNNLKTSINIVDNQ